MSPYTIRIIEYVALRGALAGDLDGPSFRSDLIQSLRSKVHEEKHSKTRQMRPRRTNLSEVAQLNNTHSTLSTVILRLPISDTSIISSA